MTLPDHEHETVVAGGTGSAAARRSARSAIIDLHPFHRMLHGGQCTKGQVQAWALNRYYYQAMIPIKDASLIARCDDADVRREWRHRLIDHDGETEGDGGIARWLKLTDGLGLDRDYVASTRGIVAGDALRGRSLCAFRARAHAAGSDRVVADRIVLAGHHQRAHGGDAGELRFRHARDARLFRQAPAAGAARFRLRARLREAARAARRKRSRPCSRRSNSNAACCGRCSTRSIMPMWRPSTFRPAPSCRRSDR